MALKMRALGACVAVAILLSGCLPDWERERVATSPDGKLQAVAEYKGSAACCSDHSRLRLVEISDGTLGDVPEVVVEVTNAKVTPYWDGNDHLIVEACGATRFDVIARVLRMNPILPDGSINAVRIDVASLPNTTRNGKVYCASASQGE